MKKIVLVLSLMACGCDWFRDEDCTTISSPNEVYIQALAYPETFDDFVSDHPEMFDPTFYNCLDKWQKDLEASSDQEKDKCDETFTTGSDFWNQCYEDVEVSIDNGIIILKTIRNVTQGLVRWDQTDIGAYLIYWKATDPAFYNEFSSLIEELAADAEICKECDTSFCFFCNV